MIIGVPKEIKDNEYRVALTPAGAEMLVANGHSVLIEKSAGVGSGFKDEEYVKVGAKIVAGPEAAWGEANMVIKVKEPLSQEYKYLRKDLILFTYLHLAANEPLTQALIKSGITAIGYETVELANHSLPLLVPMSEVAGRMSVQVAAHYLEKASGGRGNLMGGVSGVAPAKVVVVGGGIVGKNAAQIALGMGAHVTIIDKSLDQLRHLSDVLHGNLTTLASTRQSVAESVRDADVVIGAVLVVGAKAPKLVTKDMISTMNPGSVIVDVAVDQGGCVETCHATTHSDPTFLVDGVIHYCVANMPGAVPRTSTIALNNATLPYMIKLANDGVAKAIACDPALAKGVNVCQGKITFEGVSQAFGLPYTPVANLM